MGGEALALVSSSIDNGTLVTLLALRVSERTNENRLSFFFLFSLTSATRFQVPFTKYSRFRTRGPHSSAAKNERPFEGKSRNQKIRPGSRASLSFPSFSFSTGRGERWFQRIGFLFDSPVRVNSMFLTGEGRLFYVTFRWLESIGPRANVFAARVFVPPWEGKGKMLKGLVKKLIGIAEGNIRISRNDRNAPSSRSSVFRLFEAQRELFFLPRAPR